jgi:DHA1 family tetracycline resistance protein-like MFS transporter
MSDGAMGASNQLEPRTGRLSDVLPIAAVTFVALLGFGAFIPVFPYFGRSLNASDGAVTLTMAAYSLGQFISAPYWGRLSDKYGRKPILVAGTCAAAVAYIFVANAKSIEMLFAARLFGGLMAGNIAAAFAAASDISTPASRAKAMGLLGAAFGLGFIFGPVLGGLLAGDALTPDVLARVAYAAAGMNVLAALAALFIFRETLKPAARVVRERAHRFSMLAGRKRLQTLTIVSFLVTTAFGMMEATMGFLSADRFAWTPKDLGLLFAVVGILSVIMQGGAIGRLTKMLGETKLLIAGLAIMTIGLVIAGLAEVPAHAYLAAVFLSVGSAVTNPTLTTLSSFEASEDERGAVLGVVQSAASLGRVAGPALGGPLYAAIAQSAPFLVGAAIAILSTVLIALALKGHPPHQRQTGDPID